MAHVQVVSVEKSALPRVLRLTGAVAYNAFMTTPVFSAIGGPVHELLVTPGETVRAGPAAPHRQQPRLLCGPLRLHQSAHCFSARRQVLYSRAGPLQSRRHCRSRLPEAESTRNQAQADLQSSEDALRALGVNDPESLAKNPPKTTSQIPVLAPVGGEIVERLVGPGQLLQAGATQVFTISDMSTVWVLVNVYQSEMCLRAPRRQRGHHHRLRIPARFHGKISYLATALDPNTRTLQARIVTENPGKKLKKDMYVTASVNAGAIANALTVPDAAVLRDTENQPFVYVQSPRNKMNSRAARFSLATATAGRTQITEWPEGRRARRR